MDEITLDPWAGRRRRSLHTRAVEGVLRGPFFSGRSGCSRLFDSVHGSGKNVLPGTREVNKNKSGREVCFLVGGRFPSRGLYNIKPHLVSPMRAIGKGDVL